MRSTLSSSGPLNLGPISTCVSGSPTFSAFTALTNFSVNSSAIFSWRYMRSLQMQIWPQFSKREATAALHRGADIGILGDDERRLAAELQPQDA